MPGPPERLGDLDETARVRTRVDLCAGREDVPGLAVSELAGGLGLDDVVDPGRAAAEILLGRLDGLQSGNARERGEEDELEALRMAHVAGILESDPHRQRVTWRAWCEIGE